MKTVLILGFVLMTRLLPLPGLAASHTMKEQPDAPARFSAGESHGGTVLGHAAGQRPGNSAVILPGDSMVEIVRKAAHVVPSPRQMAWQELEFIAFVHFGTNTFTDREWGQGDESPAVFNPTDFDARQWVKVIRDAGMKMLIVTAKHHDGLCLWPTAYTEHSIRNSPWRDGRGDVVGEVAAACREVGLKFGVYLSPWDRHEPSYGDSPKYNVHFKNQLRELLSNYGDVAEVWFDGACGEGPNGKKQEYDWQSYYRLIRELQPEAVIAVMGPDVRWVGTESGYGRETEWSVVPSVVQQEDSIAAHSQQNPVEGGFVPGDLTGEDLGGREKIKDAQMLMWYPAETDVSIRPGWFYHAAQDELVKSPGKLVDIYYSSVGRNSVLLLNIPPDKRGRIHDNDIKSLMGMRRILDQTFRVNLAGGAVVKASSAERGHEAASVIDDDPLTYWTTVEGVEAATLEWELPAAATFDRAMLQEQIRVGQRVEQFRLEAWNGSGWQQCAGGTTIGYKRLLRFPAVTTTKVRLVIEESRTAPTLAEFGLYKSPPSVVMDPGSGAFSDTICVRLSSDTEGATICYTVDGSDPTLASARYMEPLLLTRSATVKAAALLGGEPGGDVATARYIKCKKLQTVSFERPSSPKYAGKGDATVIDGRRGTPDFSEREWLGFEGDDLVATVDLGERQPINVITAGFLQDQGRWIFLPSRVVFSVSDDGEHWRGLATLVNPVVQSERVLVKDVAHSVGSAQARFVRVSAQNVGTCPEWHSSAGGKAWLFLDEIIVE